MHLLLPSTTGSSRGTHASFSGNRLLQVLLELQLVLFQRKPEPADLPRLTYSAVFWNAGSKDVPAASPAKREFSAEVKELQFW